MMNQGRSFSGNERHCVFLNTGANNRGGRRFACISAVSGLDFPDDGRAMSVVDWDQDGDQDLWISNRNGPRIRFMRNDCPSKANYLAVQLVGNGSTTNRDAIGARVEVIAVVSGKPKSGHLPMIKSLRAGEGFLGQSSKWLHFGLGRRGKMQNIAVTWPDGDVERFNGIKPNHRYQLVQGTGTAREVSAADRTVQLAAADVQAAAAVNSLRIPLYPLLKAPKLIYTDFDGNDQSVSTLHKGPILINCWSTTCSPCLKELKDFVQRAGNIRAAGIQVLALSLDRLQQNSASENAAADLLKDMTFPFAAGHATKETMQILFLMKNALTVTGDELPVPTSFLIDSSGRLAVIYKGPLSVDDLIDDVHHSKLASVDRFKHAGAMDGRVVDNPITDKILEKSAVVALYDFAQLLQAQGFQAEADQQLTTLAQMKDKSIHARSILAEMLFVRGNQLALKKMWPEAAASYRESIESRPEHADTHYNLANMYGKLAERVLAEHHYKRAIEIQPQMTSAHANLGRLLGRQKRWPEAAVHLELVIRARPDDAESHYNLGLAMVQQGFWKRASEQFQAALSIRPDFPEAIRSLKRAEEARAAQK